MRKKKSFKNLNQKRKKWPISKIEKTFTLVKENNSDSGDKNFILMKISKSVGEIIGRIELSRRNVIFHSNIKRRFRGKGIGTYFYERVLLANKKLITIPNSTSLEARRVHKSLMKKWEHEIDVYGEKIRGEEGCIIYYPKLKKKK